MTSRDVARLTWSGYTPEQIAARHSTIDRVVSPREIEEIMAQPSYQADYEAIDSLFRPKTEDLPPAPETYSFRVSAEICAYERGMGKGMHCYDEFIQATDWDDAKRQALEIVQAKQWRWTKWQYTQGGWEKNRTAKDFTYSWLRVDPAEP